MASLNKQALIRYRIIDELIRKGDYPSMQDIISKCEYRLGKWFSVETIQKDIEAMKNDISLGYEAPIYYNRTYKGYEYTDENYSVNNLNLKKEEYEVLENAVDLLKQFKGTRLSSNYNNAVNKILTGIRASQSNKSAPVISLEFQTDFAGGELFDDFIEFIKEKTAISVVYTFNNQFRGDIIHPYMLKEYENRWYLIAYSEDSEKIKVFDIRFLYDIYILTGRKFIFKNFNADSFFKHSIGVGIIENFKEKVQIEFKRKVYDEINSIPLHQSQKIIKYKKNGNFIIEIEVYVTNELLNKILSFGAAATIIKPMYIADTLQFVIQEMLKNYTKK